MRAFVNKGRFKRLLSKIPVHVILNTNTALLGAAFLAASLGKRKGANPGSPSQRPAAGNQLVVEQGRKSFGRASFPR